MKILFVVVIVGILVGCGGGGGGGSSAPLETVSLDDEYVTIVTPDLEPTIFSRWINVNTAEILDLEYQSFYYPWMSISGIDYSSCNCTNRLDGDEFEGIYTIHCTNKYASTPGYPDSCGLLDKTFSYTRDGDTLLLDEAWGTQLYVLER